MTQLAVECQPEYLPAAARPLRARRELDTPIILLALLGCLLLLVGFLSAWGIKRIDQDYSNLIKQTALDLDRLHDISYHSGIGCATAIELAATRDPLQRAAMLRAIADERWANNQVFSELLSKATDPRLRACFDEVLARRAVFTNRTDEFLREISASGQLASGESNVVSVLEAFISYQKSCDTVADVVRSKSMEASNQLTKDAANFRLLFFAAGALPILLGLAGILLTFYFVLLTPAEADLKE